MSMSEVMRYRPPINPIGFARTAPPRADTAKVLSKIGDSLHAIAKRFGVSPQNIERANPQLGLPDRVLRVGTDVNLPLGEHDGHAKVHTAEVGDNPGGVAQRYGVSELALREANGLSPAARLEPGQQVLIPAADGSTTPPGRAELRAALEQAGVDLGKLTPEQATQAIDAAKSLRDGDTAQKIDGLATLAKTLPLGSLAKVANALGVKDSAALKLASDPKALQSLATLADPNAAKTDKVAAALTLANSLGNAAPAALQKTLERYLGVLPFGADLAKAIGTWIDPNASGLDKAKAALDVAKASKDFAGTAFPQLAQKLRAADSLTASVGAALTLLDPTASLSDKAHATAQLAANLPDLRGDVKQLLDLFKRQGVGNAEAVVGLADHLKALERLPADLRKAIGPEVAAELSGAEVAQLEKLAADKELAPALTQVLSRLKTGEAAASLIKTLAEGPGDAVAKKALLASLGGLRDGVADKLLASAVNGKPAAEVFAKLTAELDAKGQGNLVKLLSEFSDKEANLLLRIADKDASGAVSKLLAVSDKVDSKLVGRFLGVFDTLLSKAGIELTGEVAAKLAGGLEKVIPIAGAVPAVKSAIDLAGIGGDKTLPPGIRFLALQGAKLNTADAALSILEAFDFETGAPVALDIAMAGAELALDLIVTDQIARFKADPTGYRTPALLDAANVALAVAGGPEGVAELAVTYGANGTLDLLGRVTREGGTAAIHAAEAAVDLPSDALRAQAHETAQGLHLLADIIRNPQKYGKATERLAQQAVARLSDLAQGAGEVAKAAGAELKSLASDLVSLGAKGVKALGWIASHPGEAATDAARALGNLAQQGLRLGGLAGQELARLSLEGLARARAALAAAGQAASEAYRAVASAVNTTVNAAINAGKAGVQALAWIANHPGEAAKIAGQALVSIASQAGAYAREAYTAITRLSEKGIELGQQVIGNLKNLGEAGVDLLEYAAAHPGETASTLRKAAGEALSDLAKLTGQVAERATGALLRLVDNGVGEVKDTVVKLLSESKDAVARAAKHWGKNLSDGAREIIGGLQDLGDAGRGALNGLAGLGVDAAKSVLHAIGDAAGWVVDHVT